MRERPPPAYEAVVLPAMAFLNLAEACLFSMPYLVVIIIQLRWSGIC